MISKWLVDLLEAQTLFIKIRDFETDCRQFFNCFNTSLNIRQLVFSVPVMNCFLGDKELFKPPDRNYSQFWVDFNLGTRSVSTYCVRNVEEEDCGWELVTLKDVDIVSVFIMSRSMNSMILTLNLSESNNPDTDSGVAEIVMESRYMEQIQSLVGRMFGDRCQVNKDQMIHDNNLGVLSETVSNLRNIPREQDEDSYSQHSSLPCAQQLKESPEVIQYKLPQLKKKNDYTGSSRNKSQIDKSPKSSKVSRTSKTVKTPKSSRFNKSKSGSGGRIGDKGGQCYTPVVALDRIPRSEEVTAQKIDLCKDNTEVEISEKISVDSDLLEKTETQKIKVLKIPEEATEGRGEIVFTETKMESGVITEEADRESVKLVEPITPEIVEDSHLHLDSDTTLSGGRKRATRKISEQEQKRIKSRIIPSQLNFDSSHNSSELKKKVSSLRQSIMNRSLKKRISQSPSLLKIPELSGQGNKLFKKLFKERKKQSCVTSQDLEVKQDRALTGNISGGGAKSLNSSLVIAKSNSNDVGPDRDSAEEFKTETRDLPKNGSVRKTYTRNKLSRRKAPRMEGVSVDNLSQSKITGEYMLKTQKLCNDQSCENKKKTPESQINNPKKIAIKKKPEVNVLSKKASCVMEVDAENVYVQGTEEKAIYEDYATTDGEAAGANLEDSPSDRGIPLADGRVHDADAGLLATHRGVPAIDSSRISMIDGENCTSIDNEVLANADVEASGVNPKASVLNRGETTADDGTFMSDGETSAVTQWLRLTLPVLKMISCHVKRLQPNDRNILKRKWSSIMDY